MQFIQTCLLAILLSSVELAMLPADALEPALKKAEPAPAKKSVEAAKKIESPAAKNSSLPLSPTAARKTNAAPAPAKKPSPEPVDTSGLTNLNGEPLPEEQAPVSKKVRRREPPNEDPTKLPDEGSGFFTNETAHTLSLEAKQMLRHHDYNRALRLLTKAIKLDDDDMECRVLYAEALDEKLNHQAEKDPDIFNKCIKSWLMVARNEIGDEKGMTIKGLGLPGIAGRYGDQDYAEKAKKRLKVLTGYTPKPWETDGRYLKKVLRPAETSVSGVIKSSSEASEEEPVRIKPRAKNEE